MRVDSNSEAEVLLNWHNASLKKQRYGSAMALTPEEIQLLKRLKSKNFPIDLSDEEVALARDWMLSAVRPKFGAASHLLPHEVELYERLKQEATISQGVDMADGMRGLRLKLAKELWNRIDSKARRKAIILGIVLGTPLMFLAYIGIVRTITNPLKCIAKTRTKSFVAGNSEQLRHLVMIRRPNLSLGGERGWVLRVENATTESLPDGYIEIGPAGNSAAINGKIHVFPLRCFRPHRLIRVGLKPNKIYGYRIMDLDRMQVDSGVITVSE